ncbi:hypothetical protein [Nocardia pseudobrasiliensis]|uniref:Uncharacterized protein n=1 Tax=Nocardia pseudobrasiliensis TaxID=45979 RepID=A0A370I4Q0_9NOCA|nr:hypothetical protein [Nocardia pseudobrasiliensis]RDI65713.1 hypothetical protein DFR76_10528 [Nocardia pseudobrasiliensis]
MLGRKVSVVSFGVAALAVVLLAGPAGAAPLSAEQKELAGKLKPEVSECLKVVAGIPRDEVKQFMDSFGKCMKEKMFGSDSQFSEAEQDMLAPRRGPCIEKSQDSSEGDRYKFGDQFLKCMIDA